MGLGTKKMKVFMIDFGLSRRYVLPSGKVRPPRDQSGFRGTARYASINAHLAKDLARRDDLWSLLYMLIEFANGILPWRRIKDKDQVGEMKIRCNTPELVADLPKEFLLLWEHLQTLRYEDEPDYEMLLEAFTSCIVSAGGSPDSTPFDWDFNPNSIGSRARTIPQLSTLCVHAVCKNLDAINRRIDVDGILQSQMLRLALRQNPKLPEHCVLKLLDSRTHTLDFEQLQPTLTPSLFEAALARCSNVKELVLGEVTDGKVAEVNKLIRGVLKLSLVANNSKLISLSKGIKPLLEANSATLTCLHLRGDVVKDNAVEQVFKSCPSLRELYLQGCKKVKGTCFSVLAKSKHAPVLHTIDLSLCELSKSGFKYFVKVCAQLRSIRLTPLAAGFSISAADLIQVLHRTSKLESLDLKSDLFELDTILLEVGLNIPGIQTLLVEGSGITDFGVQNVLTACTQIKHLALTCGDGISDASLQLVSKACTTLESLKLHFVTRANRNLVSEHALRALLAACTNVKDLSLQNCLLLTLHSFPEEGLYSSMTRLCVSDCLQVDDMAVERLVQLCPNLRVLDLSSLNSLTSMSLSHVATWCLLLEELILLNCACFEDESLNMMLAALPLIFMRISRFPNSINTPVDFTVHQGNVRQVLTGISNHNRLQALEKKKLFGTLYH
jgi:hypothetical protein